MEYNEWKYRYNIQADVNKVDRHGQTPLFITSLKGHLDIVQVLLEHVDINIDASNYDGHTPLFIACKENKVDVIKVLLLHNVCILI